MESKLEREVYVYIKKTSTVYSIVNRVKLSIYINSDNSSLFFFHSLPSASADHSHT